MTAIPSVGDATVETILLGSAQDAGVPQAGCACARCQRAWQDPAHRHLVACLGMVDYRSGQAWMVDATPDFREQLALLLHSGSRAAGPGVLPLELAGIFLTHAHIGHYTGLIHLGREGWNVQGLPLYVTARMAAFLRAHAPWCQLVAEGNVRLQVVESNVQLLLAPELHATPCTVPHRDEWSDTVAWEFHGPTRRLFYCPDIDRWDARTVARVARADVALLDGTFWSPDELPGRDLRTIPHPFVRTSVEHFAGVPTTVRFLHLNHSNPLLDDGPERAWLAARGIAVAHEGQRWTL